MNRLLRFPFQRSVTYIVVPLSVFGYLPCLLVVFFLIMKAKEKQSNVRDWVMLLVVRFRLETRKYR